MKPTHSPHAARLTVIDIREAATELGDQSYEASLPAAEALATSDIKQISVDVSTAVGTIEASFPRVHAMRDALVSLPGFPPSAIDSLPRWTLALGNADARYAAETTPPGALGAFVSEGRILRDQLFTQAGTLGKFGLLDPAGLAALSSGQGHRSIGRDLQALARAYRDNWTRLEGKSAVTGAHLARAMFLGEQITALVAFKEQTPSQTSAAADVRRRMFTLVDDAWDEIRRGVTYLRWHEGDLDEIAPSIHARLGAGRKPTASQPPEPPTSQPASPPPPAAASASEAVSSGPDSSPFRDA